MKEVTFINMQAANRWLWGLNLDQETVWRVGCTLCQPSPSSQHYRPGQVSSLPSLFLIPRGLSGNAAGAYVLWLLWTWGIRTRIVVGSYGKPKQMGRLLLCHKHFSPACHYGIYHLIKHHPHQEGQQHNGQMLSLAHVFICNLVQYLSSFLFFLGHPH